MKSAARSAMSSHAPGLDCGWRHDGGPAAHGECAGSRWLSTSQASILWALELPVDAPTAETSATDIARSAGFSNA
ncbi:MAG TPA: hypothetical protein VJQ61_10510 [Sinomonas sp.]|nr:hypothetical protein [Sinomonas sp.]